MLFTFKDRLQDVIEEYMEYGFIYKLLDCGLNC